jgi:hypothetical protein
LLHRHGAREPQGASDIGRGGILVSVEVVHHFFPSSDRRYIVSPPWDIAAFVNEQATVPGRAVGTPVKPARIAPN